MIKKHYLFGFEFGVVLDGFDEAIEQREDGGFSANVSFMKNEDGVYDVTSVPVFEENGKLYIENKTFIQFCEKNNLLGQAFIYDKNSYQLWRDMTPEERILAEILAYDEADEEGGD